jgi:uncharacterized protein
MSTRDAHNLAIHEISEEAVVHYLQQNPEFFERQQALLAHLRLPHARGAATVSLVERQVEVLRGKHTALEEKLGDFVRIARINDTIAERLHGFTRRLLRAQNRKQVLESIETGLRVDFDAFNSVLFLVNETAIEAESRFLRQLRPEDPALKSFESLFAGGKPRCGQVRDSQREFLFGMEADDIGSVALVPLGANGAIGLLALGSNDRDRFHPGMSTEFLTRLGELVADALSQD